MKDLESMNGDLVADIVSRLDGLALASFASTSSYLRPIALHPSLWRKLCHSTWPSTAHSDDPLSSPHHFFVDSFPFLFYDEAAATVAITSTSPCDFVSFVDVFYKKQCVFSTVVRGIPQVSDASASKLMDTHHSKFISDERWKWFLNCPFELQLLHLACDDDDDDDDDWEEEEDGVSYPETSNDNNRELMNDLRLSWILLDNKTGKSVNLSTWKPISIQSVWPHKEEDYIMHFGSIIPVEQSMLPDKLARINITTKFKLKEKLQWREISMSIEDTRGALADGRTSLMILNKALYSIRTTNQLKVENGFDQYQRKKAEMNRRSKFGEIVTNGMYICVQFAVFAILCNALIR